PLEERLHGQEMEATARDVWMSLGDLHRQATLRGANVDYRPVLLPRKLGCDGRSRQQGPRGHSFFKDFKRLVVGIQGRKIIPIACFTLRLSSPERPCQKLPMRVSAHIEVVELSSNVGLLPSTKVKVGLRRVAVTTAGVSFDELERDERIEEIT